MKKRVLLGMILMASMSFHSCTKEIVIVQEGGEGIENPAGPDGQVLTLQVANVGDGLSSRAGRPLLSSQAKQDINTIVLYVVDGSNKVVLKKTISAGEWANALAYSNTDGQGKQLQISFKESNGQKLTGSDSGTEYTIYAVGYKNETGAATNYKVADKDLGVKGSGDTDPVVPTTVGQKDANATLKANDFASELNTVTTAADEIFAGTVKIKVHEVTSPEADSYITTATGSSKKDIPTLVLNRQVAGVTGYFTNIKAKYGEQIPAKLRLVASGKSNKVHFTSMVDGETDNNTAKAATNVVNGSGSLTQDALYFDNTKKGYKVYEIALKSFFPMIGKKNEAASSGGDEVLYTFADMDKDGDGFVGYKDAQYYVYGAAPSDEDLKGWAEDIKGGATHGTGKTNKLSDFWKNPNEGTQTLVAGSVFGGQFIIPFLQVSGTNTLELQVLDEEDNILANWNVKVPDKVSTGGSVAGGITGGTWSADGDYVYNIYRNHLYSLGLKTNDIEGGDDPTDEDEDGNPDPVDPKPEPDPDGSGEDPEDQPEDLSKGQNLLLNVNSNWEIIHQMIID